MQVGGTVTARLTLVSHARLGDGRQPRFPVDEPLDAGELDQALAAAPGLRAVGPAFCDATARTRQTAEALGLTAAPDSALADLDVGAWRGRRLDEVAEPDLVAWTTDAGAAPHGGESVLDLLARVAAWLSTPANGVAVTHPAVVRAALVVALRCPPDVYWRIDVPPLTATRLHWRGAWTLRHACRPLS